MATISIEIGKKGKKEERAVCFLIIVGNTKRRLPTGIHINNSDVTDGGKIKNVRYERMLELKRRELQDKMFEIQLNAMGREIDADYIAERLLAQPKEVDFFEFADDWLSRPENKHKKNYYTMLKSFEGYLGKRTLPFSLINFRLLSGYEMYLLQKQRAQSLYLGQIRHIFREAMREINTDYETTIKNDPFLRYRVPKQIVRAGVRALTLDELMRIYNYEGRPHSRAQLARDCFILSFCLMGMNSADMYECEDGKDGVLKYKRRKTRTRRSDEAYIEVNVHPILKSLMYRYSDNNRVWNFYRRYRSLEDFNRSLNVGLKEVGREVGIRRLSFYQARHTFATLSRNLMKFSKSDVDEALNHVGSYEIADIYIKKDFSIINENNRLLIEEVFKK